MLPQGTCALLSWYMLHRSVPEPLRPAQGLEDRLQSLVEPQLAAALAKHDGAWSL